MESPEERIQDTIDKWNLEQWSQEGPIRGCCGEVYNSDETGCVFCGKDMDDDCTVVGKGQER